MQREWVRLSDSLSTLLTLVLVAASPLAIGTVHAATKATAFGLSGLILALVLVGCSLGDKRAFVPIFAWVLGLLCLGAAAQLIPLSTSVHLALSKAGDAIFQFAAGTKDYPARPLSLDAPATLGELGKLTAYLAFFLAVAIHFRRPSRSRLLLQVLVATALGVALIGVVQAVFDPDRLLFFYQPTRSFGVWVRGTFVNANHFGALMCLTAPVALNLALQGRSRKETALWLAGCLLLNIATVASLSRAAIGALAIAEVGVAATFVLLRGRNAVSLGRTLGVIAFLSAGLLFASIATVDHMKAIDFSFSAERDNPQSKQFAWRNSIPMIRDFGWTGSGRGAFESAFGRYNTEGGKVTYPWIENTPLQIAIDFGLPIATIAFVLLILAFWSAAMVVRRQPEFLGALGGLVALFLHDLADFSFEIPGVMLPALALAGTLFAATRERATHRFSVSPRHAKWLWPIAVVPVALIIPNLRQKNIDTELKELVAERHLPNHIETRARELLAHHPADYAIPLLAGHLLDSAQHPTAIGWINHAMFLSPNHSRPHLLAGLFLARNQRHRQAQLEFRTAASNDANPHREIWPRALELFPNVESLKYIVGGEVALANSLSKFLGNHNQRSLAKGITQHALQLDSNNIRAMQDLLYYELGTTPSEEALRILKKLLTLDQTDKTFEIVARIQLASGSPSEAVSSLKRVHARNENLLELRCKTAIELARAGNAGEARRLMGLTQAWVLSPGLLAQTHDALSQIETLEGNPHRAAWEASRRDHLRGKHP
ncbi:MAG: O-antigen ligase family protein [Deltaproteobacteria bacterium]|nr:O-antigen ligase family protein [Deltaproteobacteria bacterium]